jgi:hypothetical protein
VSLINLLGGPNAKAKVTVQLSDKWDQDETRRLKLEEQRKEQENEQQIIIAAGVWFEI